MYINKVLHTQELDHTEKSNRCGSTETKLVRIIFVSTDSPLKKTKQKKQRQKRGHPTVLRKKSTSLISWSLADTTKTFPLLMWNKVIGAITSSGWDSAEIWVIQIEQSHMKSISLVWHSNLFLWSHCWFASGNCIFLLLLMTLELWVSVTSDTDSPLPCFQPLFKFDTACLQQIYSKINQKDNLLMCWTSRDRSVKIIFQVNFYCRSNTRELTKLYRGMPGEIPQDFTRQQSQVTVKVRISHYREKYRN